MPPPVRPEEIIDWADPGARELGDGNRVEVRIVLWEAPDALRVPNGSLFRRGEDWAVLPVEDERARLRTVELGRRNQNDAQVLKGLSPGQSVVLHPPDALRDGMRIRAPQR